MRDIGFSQNDDIRSYDIQYCAEQLDHIMGLGQVNAAGSDFLPQIGNGIQSQDARILLRIKKQDVDHFFEHIQAFEVKVDLVGTECGPEMHRLPVLFRVLR